MKLECIIEFTQQERVDIDRKLQYIDFLSGRTFAIRNDADNILETYVASLVLSRHPYTVDQLRGFVVNKEQHTANEHLFLSFYDCVSTLLSDKVDTHFDESRIMQLYDRLLSSQEDEWPTSSVRNRGLWQSEIISVAKEISPHLCELVEWYLIETSRKTIHPLVAVGAFLYRFVTCDTMPHYKQEMMHLLALLLLRRSNVHWIILYSPMRFMLLDRVAYHSRLKLSDNSSQALSHWLVYWIDMLYNAARCVCSEMSPELQAASPSRKSPINMRQRRILDFIANNQPVKLAAIVDYLHKESVNTVKKDLLRLRELGYISSQGKLKGTVYYRV